MKNNLSLFEVMRWVGVVNKTPDDLDANTAALLRLLSDGTVVAAGRRSDHEQQAFEDIPSDVWEMTRYEDDASRATDDYVRYHCLSFIDHSRRDEGGFGGALTLNTPSDTLMKKGPTWFGIRVKADTLKFLTIRSEPAPVAAGDAPATPVASPGIDLTAAIESMVKYCQGRNFSTWTQAEAVRELRNVASRERIRKATRQSGYFSTRPGVTGRVSPNRNQELAEIRQFLGLA